MTRRLAMSLIALWLSLALAACDADKVASSTPPPSAAESSGGGAHMAIAGLDTERKQVSYMIGLDLAKNLTPIKDEVDIDTVVQALRAAHAGEKPLLDEAQAGTIRKQFVEHLRLKRESEQKALAAKNLQDGDAFLAKNAAKTGVITTASGLQYQVLSIGKGIRPSASDTVRVNYIATFLNGTEFDNTYKTDHTASFVLNQSMPGMAEGLALMPVGSKYRFWIPAKLAYGDSGVVNIIGPNAMLIYEVELMEIAGPPSKEPEQPGTRD